MIYSEREGFAAGACMGIRIEKARRMQYNKTKNIAVLRRISRRKAYE